MNCLILCIYHLFTLLSAQRMRKVFKYEIYYSHYYCCVFYLLVVCATGNIYINQKYMNGYLVLNMKERHK